MPGIPKRIHLIKFVHDPFRVIFRFAGNPQPVRPTAQVPFADSSMEEKGYNL
jgi:hypothetical protein